MRSTSNRAGLGRLRPSCDKLEPGSLSTGEKKGRRSAPSSPARERLLRGGRTAGAGAGAGAGIVRRAPALRGFQPERMIGKPEGFDGRHGGLRNHAREIAKGEMLARSVFLRDFGFHYLAKLQYGEYGIGIVDSAHDFILRSDT